MSKRMNYKPHVNIIRDPVKIRGARQYPLKSFEISILVSFPKDSYTSLDVDSRHPKGNVIDGTRYVSFILSGQKTGQKRYVEKYMSIKKSDLEPLENRMKITIFEPDDPGGQHPVTVNYEDADEE